MREQLDKLVESAIDRVRNCIDGFQRYDVQTELAAKIVLTYLKATAQPNEAQQKQENRVLVVNIPPALENKAQEIENASAKRTQPVAIPE